MYLNPPPPPTPIRDTIRPEPVRPVESPISFKLIGISYCTSNPELSLALIDETGKGLHWVKQSSKVEHVLIQEIKNDAVIVKDGERTISLVPEREPKISLIKGENKPVPPGGPISITSLNSSKTMTAAAITPPQTVKQPEMSEAERTKLLESMLSELMTPQSNPQKNDSNAVSPSSANAGRISAEEAATISSIGQTDVNSNFAAKPAKVPAPTAQPSTPKTLPRRRPIRSFK